MKTVNGVKEVEGRKHSGLTLEGVDGTVRAMSPALVECNSIPGNRTEIPTPETAASFDLLNRLLQVYYH